MKVAILCPGPSLKLWTGIQTVAYRHIVAVNRVGLSHACDTWIVLDGGMSNPKNPPPIDSYDLRNHIMHCHTDPLWDGPWAEFSAGWACAYAAVVLKATEIDVYGMDMEGDRYWDGTQQISCRPATRWQHERRHVASLMAALADRGIVMRIPRLAKKADDSLTCSSL